MLCLAECAGEEPTAALDPRYAGSNRVNIHLRNQSDALNSRALRNHTIRDGGGFEVQITHAIQPLG